MEFWLRKHNKVVNIDCNSAAEMPMNGTSSFKTESSCSFFGRDTWQQTRPVGRPQMRWQDDNYWANTAEKELKWKLDLVRPAEFFLFSLFK